MSKVNPKITKATSEEQKIGIEKTVTGTLEDAIKVTGSKGVDDIPVEVNIAKKTLKVDPIEISNPSLNVTLSTNERPSDEFTTEDLFNSLENLKNVFDNVNGSVIGNDYKTMKQKIEDNIDSNFPNDPTNYKFSNYKFSHKIKDADLIRKIGIKDEKGSDIYPPGLELIYNYWLDVGFTSQTLFAITERYRNKPGRWSEKLMNFTLDPLRRVNDLLSGYIKDLRIGELQTAEERSLEYQNQYGYFIANGNYYRGLEVRSNFHSAFNNLLSECARYFRQTDDKTLNANGFPVLSALQELNIILVTGDINQAVSFAKRARIEALIEQIILDRSEIGDYLKERPMVPYAHNWMRRVDAMKSIQGWNPTSIRIFNDLAESGEIILLSVRFINWSEITEEDFAKAWAGRFRNEIQQYIHRYSAVTGVDLSLEATMSSDYKIRDILPSVLIQRSIQRRYF